MAGTVGGGGVQNRTWGARLVVLVPYLWLIVFFLVPFLIVMKISLSQTAIAQPPYTPVFDPAAGWEGLKAFVAGLSFETTPSSLPTGSIFPRISRVSKSPRARQRFCS